MRPPLSGNSPVTKLAPHTSAPVLAAVLLAQPGAAAPSASVRTLVQARVPIAALAQDGRRIAWIQPRARRYVGIRDLATGTRVYLPRGRFASEIGYPEPLSVIALSGGRAVYVLYEQQGNTEEHYFVVTAASQDRTERFLSMELEANCPCPEGYNPSWPLAADGAAVLFRKGPGINRLVGRRSVRVRGRPVGDVLAVSRKRYASAWLRSSGGCLCNLDPSWSPDGSRLAFGSGRPLSFHETAQTRIHVVGVDGSGSRAISPGSQPDWSPDGSLIAYVRRIGTAAVYLIRPDGSGAQRLTAGSDPDWHPDGRTLAFVRGNAIHVASRDGSGVARVTEGQSPAWSPDGRRLAYVRDGEIHVVNADGGAATRLTQGDFERRSSDPSWSPDGRRIAYTVYNVPQATGEVEDAHVIVMNADGSGKRRLGVGRSATPAWSPDGSRIAYGGWLPRRHPARFIPSTEILTAAADGTAQNRVTRTSVAEPTSTGFVRSLGRPGKTTVLRFEGAISGLALSPAFAAVLVQRLEDTQLLFLHPGTGRVLRRMVVPDSSRAISASGRRVVFVVGREIRLVDARGHGVATIARAPVEPRGLSIEGRRVAWIENRTGRGRIRALNLPR